jgi:hypothetical protein
MDGADDVTRIDCGTCAVRGPAACGDCVVTFLLGAPPQGVVIDAEERRALDALAGVGLVPPLRMARAVETPTPPGRRTG